MDWLSIISSSVFSGLLGVAISNVYHNRNEIRREKLQLLGQLIGNRYDLQGEAYSEALNKVCITFYKSKNVLDCLKKFHDIVTTRNQNLALANDALLDLFKAMCNDVGIKIEPLNDTFLLSAFNTRAARTIPINVSNRTNNT